MKKQSKATKKLNNRIKELCEGLGYELPVMYHEIPPQKRREVRQQYVEVQDGKCMYCGESLSCKAPKRITAKAIDWRRFPKNFLKYPIHLQHDHKTGLTEGAVHNYCNAVLWQYEGR